MRDKAKCLLAVTRRMFAAGGGSPEWLEPCRDRFDGGVDPSASCFAKRERHATCLTTGDTATLETRVEDFRHEALCLLGSVSDCPTPSPTPTVTVSPTPTLTPTPTLPCVACACPAPPTPATPVPTCTTGCPIPTASPPPCGAGFGPPSCSFNAYGYRQVCGTDGGSCGCAACCPCP